MRPDYLKALAEQDRDQEASPTVEAQVLGAFRQRKRRRAVMRGIWLTCAAAAVTAGFVVQQGREPLPKVAIPVQSQPIQVSEAQDVVAPIPVVPKKVRRAKPAPLREVVTRFYPLMDAPPPFERGELVRVTLPASAMLSVGLPVREDQLTQRVEADVLVGQEGFAHAIRFVSYER